MYLKISNRGWDAKKTVRDFKHILLPSLRNLCGEDAMIEMPKMLRAICSSPAKIRRKKCMQSTGL